MNNSKKIEELEKVGAISKLERQRAREEAVEYAYICKSLLSYLIPIKCNTKEWAKVRATPYTAMRKGFFSFDIKIVLTDSIPHLEFSCYKNRTSIPMRRANKYFTINKIIKGVHECIKFNEFRGMEISEIKATLDEFRNYTITKGLSNWLKKSFSGDDLKSDVEYRKEKINAFYELINIYIVIASRIASSKRPILGFVIDKKDFRLRKEDKSYSEYLKSKVWFRDPSGYNVMRINRKCEMIERFTEIDKNYKPRMWYYNILPDELHRFIDLCGSNCEQHAQNYMGMVILKNNDIFVIDTGQIEFVRREDKWINISYTYFRYALRYSNQQINDKVIRYLYALIIKACINNEEFIIHIVSPEYNSKFIKEVIERCPYNYIQGLGEYSKSDDNDERLSKMLELNDVINEKRIEVMNPDDVYNLFIDNEVITITEGGVILALEPYDIYQYQDRKSLCRMLSKTGLTIGVSLDYGIRIFEKEEMFYSTI